jgi:hypothetical protein
MFRKFLLSAFTGLIAAVIVFGHVFAGEPYTVLVLD